MSESLLAYSSSGCLPSCGVLAKRFREPLSTPTAMVWTTVQGAVVQTMAVGVAGLEGNPARKPLGQGRLQAVVVGMRKVLRLVDEAQVGEFIGVRSDAGRRIDLIDVAATGQSVAVIANIAHVQRKVVREGVLDSKVPVHGVWVLEIRVHGDDAAGYVLCATEYGAFRKNNVVPERRRIQLHKGRTLQHR